jgi:hypothetical protein
MDLNKDYLIILNALSDKGGTGNIMEILSYSSSQFEDGFMIANQMQNMDLVKLLYSNFNKNTIVVELTLLGENKNDLRI